MWSGLVLGGGKVNGKGVPPSDPHLEIGYQPLALLLSAAIQSNGQWKRLVGTLRALLQRAIGKSLWDCVRCV